MERWLCYLHVNASSERMIRCTAQGHGDTPGLPMLELQQLKEEIGRTLPHKWNVPTEMEQIWSKCLEAVSQGCKRLRRKNKFTSPAVQIIT